MAFTIICGIVLIIFLGIFMAKTKKEEVKPEVVKPKEESPVIIELFPKGTSNNPYMCKVSSEIALEVKGYSDYKKENEVVLNDGHCSWHKSCPVGSFAKEYGTKNIYYTPSIKGERAIWVDYNDGKFRSSAKLRLIVEV